MGTISIFLGVLIIFLIFILIGVISYYQRKLSKITQQMEQLKINLSQQSNQLAQQQFNQWVQQYSQQLREQIEETTRKEYEVEFQKWKQQEEKRIREDSKARSFSVNRGHIGEYFAPFVLAEKFNINLKDFRHLGSPVDFIGFKGLSDEGIEPEIIFFEVKTGKSSLNANEKKVREAIMNKRVRYETVNLNELVKEIQERNNISKNGLNTSAKKS